MHEKLIKKLILPVPVKVWQIYVLHKKSRTPDPSLVKARDECFHDYQNKILILDHLFSN